jgi:hypothetical protein
MQRVTGSFGNKFSVACSTSLHSGKERPYRQNVDVLFTFLWSISPKTKASSVAADTNVQVALITRTCDSVAKCFAARRSSVAPPFIIRVEPAESPLVHPSPEICEKQT